MQWDLKGFVLLSFTPKGTPFLHGFYHTRWEAELAFNEAEALPADLRSGLHVTHAKLAFNATPNAQVTGRGPKETG